MRTRWGRGGRHYERFDDFARNGPLRKIPDRTAGSQKVVISPAAFPQVRIGRGKGRAVGDKGHGAKLRIPGEFPDGFPVPIGPCFSGCAFDRPSKVRWFVAGCRTHPAMWLYSFSCPVLCSADWVGRTYTRGRHPHRQYSYWLLCWWSVFCRASGSLHRLRP